VAESANRESAAHVLLLDDDPEDRGLAKLVLQHELPQVEIEEVRDALAFAQACGRRNFHLVVLEQRLGWADGLAILSALKEDWPEVPVIMFTRFGSEEVSVRALRLGVDHYLVKKPANFLRLPLAVRTSLEQARSRPRPPRRASRLETLLSRARMGVFSAAPDGRLLNASPALLEILGVETLEEASRLDLLPLVAGYERDATNGEAREVGPAREIELRRADGRPLMAQVIRTVLRDGEGHVRIDGLLEDVTERRSAEEDALQRTSQLRRANEDLQQFALTASHELQEPARMIEKYTELLREDYRGRLDAEADELIDLVAASTQRLQSLVNDLLAFSRLESRQGPLERVAAGELVERALADLEAAIEESGAVITQDELPVIEANPSQIIQLFVNLIGNAIKFHGDAPPRIHISAQRSGREWTFAVRDNGIGIDPAETESIFTMFRRLNPEVPGSGVGLALCRKIVERHGGRIWVTSRPGQGATFQFTLPLPREA
jgi:PAS domain S-box-containing protein